MIRFPILDICARVEGHEVQHAMLREYCHDFTTWDTLLEHAEMEGMAPLLKKHLEESDSSYPLSVRRTLNILAKRHQNQAKVRIDVLQEVLELFRARNLTPLILKGAALCHIVYPDPALRPMRDMDILLREEEVWEAQAALENSGFSRSNAPIPGDHFHLPSLHKNVAGMNVCIELHRGLYPRCPPYYPEVNFDQLLRSAASFKVGSVDALTFNDEETLHYLYQHGFHAPLTYEPYKLINVADIVSFTEKNYATLDWQRIRQQFPLLSSALPLMHHISPWNCTTIPDDFVSLQIRKKRLSPVSFTGWPKRRLRELKASGRKRHQILFDTFFPPSWWLQIYYGAVTKQERFWCVVYTHPRHIYWWARLYASFR